MGKYACKACKFVYQSGNKCPKCGSEERSESFKGDVVILKPAESEIAKNLKLADKGKFAIKLG